MERKIIVGYDGSPGVHDALMLARRLGELADRMSQREPATASRSNAEDRRTSPVCGSGLSDSRSD
jgi:hypothetical protein